MTTLAQALQTTPPPPLPITLRAVQSATAATVTTALGPVVNATGATPSGGSVVVVQISGTPYAIGWQRP
ncbi:hypothetical protein ACIRQY_29130 [Streptomyces sp. NPDC101490]|uniref:hypothetical protein n=1 Tax=Streptomyces sp. NPDC101490 TaxID=3366143 RepID=UPI0037FC2592